jgi:hypothetical protein
VVAEHADEQHQQQQRQQHGRVARLPVAEQREQVVAGLVQQQA